MSPKAKEVFSPLLLCVFVGTVVRGLRSPFNDAKIKEPTTGNRKMFIFITENQCTMNCIKIVC